MKEIFKPDIGNIDNNEKVYYSFIEQKENHKSTNLSPEDFIKNMEKEGYIFSKKVIVKTKDNTYNTKIAGKVKDKIITMESKIIPISDITEIYYQ